MLLHKAETFSPNKPSVYFALAEFTWRHTPSKIFNIINFYILGISHSLADTTIFTTLIANLMLMILITLLISFALLAVILAVKYIPLAANDIKVFLDWDVSLWLFILFIILLLVIFASLNLGIIWTIIFMTLTLSIYYTKTERYLSAVFYVLLVISPILMNNTATMMLSTHQQVIDEMISVREDTYSDMVEKELKVWNLNHPDDTDVLFTLGLMNKKRGELKLAEKYYLETLKIEPNHPLALNNLGNIYFILGEYDRAEVYYLKSLDIDSNSATTYYNLYKRSISGDEFDIYKAEEYREKADELSPDLINSFVDREARGSEDTLTYLDRVNRVVMDRYISDTVFWGRILSSSSAKTISASIWADLMKGVTFRLTSGISVFILALLFIFATLRNRYVFSKACKYCWEPFLLKSLTHMDKRDSCNRCFSVFIRREGVDPKTKADLRMRVERKRNVIRIVLRIINLLLPGFGSIFRGYTIKGFIFLLLYIFCVINIVYIDGIIVYPMHAAGFPIIHNFFLYFILLIIVYIIAQRDFFVSERLT
ncbi:MAG: tetratricopeptide repeat protein [Deltaproteobacteria bacterium]|nr:tetratricopeptide repeat protein [Candidatus Zymogenaceae bacterium]